MRLGKVTITRHLIDDWESLKVILEESDIIEKSSVVIQNGDTQKIFESHFFDEIEGEKMIPEYVITIIRLDDGSNKVKDITRV